MTATTASTKASCPNSTPTLKNNKAGGISWGGNPTSVNAPAKPKPCSNPNVKMALSLTVWASYTEGKVKLQRRSENAVRSDHVLSFSYTPEEQVVAGVVQASMRNASYKVMVSLLTVPVAKCVFKPLSIHDQAKCQV